MKKNNYANYKATDFLLEETFLRWMASDDAALDHFWNNWIADHPHQKAEIALACKIYHALKFKQVSVSKTTIEEEWLKLTQNIALQEEPALPASLTKPRYTNWRIWFAAASISLMVLTGGFLLRNDPFSVSSGKTEITKTAQKGQRLEFKLPDGTQVQLNAGSSVTYPDQFEASRRIVNLQGEAFFDVVPNSNAPFLINSGDVTTEVVGTSFGIAAYPENKDIRIAVVSGKVNVYSSESIRNNTKLTLTPKQMATFENDEKVFVVTPFDRDKQLAWTSGVLYFDKADFGYVVRKLENWYGVTVVTSPDLVVSEDLLLTGKFKNKTLDYVLDSYRYPDRFTYQIKNDTILIQ